VRIYVCRKQLLAALGHFSLGALLISSYHVNLSNLLTQLRIFLLYRQYVHREIKALHFMTLIFKKYHNSKNLEVSI
jgi:hypothetical protein